MNSLKVSLEKFKTFLKFKSISADPTYLEQIDGCADWLSSWLKEMGFEVEKLATENKIPIVFAEITLTNTNKIPRKTILYYGHYDVQPVDPIELWESDPFEAIVKNARVYARGAQDNKGQTFYVSSALEKLISDFKNNSIEINKTIKIILEGEEECGSYGIAKLLPTITDKISADVLLVCDTGTIDIKRPTLTLGLRGVAYAEVEITSAEKDLHSGVHGGVAANPIIVLSQIIAKMYTSEGKIAVPSFMKDVKAPNAAERKILEESLLTPELYKQLVGIEPLGGQQDIKIAERLGFLPTIEFNGIISGHTGKGSKTIIPASVRAKITTRLVADQEAEKAINSVVDFIRENLPQGFKLKVNEYVAEGSYLRVDPENRSIKVAKLILDKIVKDTFPQENSEGIFWYEGASIPILSDLSKRAKAEPVLVGFGLEEDNIHAPNESFSFLQLNLGYEFAYQFFKSEIHTQRTSSCS